MDHRAIVHWEHDYDSRFLVNEDDLLLSLSGSFRIAKWKGPKALLNQRVVKLTPRDELDERWLYHALSYKIDHIERMGKHALVNNVSLTDLRQFEIPLPPLSEQKRIADILDKADAIRRKRQEAIDLTRTIENSLFAEMFLHNTNEKKSKIQFLEELCSVIRDGVHKTPKYVSEGIPFVTVKNLTAKPNSISFGNCKFISPCDHADFSKRTNPEIGDILVSKDGTIGVAREITEGLPFNIFVSVALLKPRRELIHPTFLKTQFNMPFVQRQILDEIKGVAIRHLHLKDFKRLSLVVPDMKDQLDFVQRIHQLHNSEETHFRALRETDNFFNSLVQRAFKGEL